jgi:hypothetical protein
MLPKQMYKTEMDIFKASYLKHSFSSIDARPPLYTLSLVSLLQNDTWSMCHACWVSPELKHTQIYVVRQLAYSTELLVCINQA